MLDSFSLNNGNENILHLSKEKFSSHLLVCPVICYFFVYFRLELPLLSLPGVTKTLLPLPAYHLLPSPPLTHRYYIVILHRFDAFFLLHTFLLPYSALNLTGHVFPCTVQWVQIFITLALQNIIQHVLVKEVPIKYINRLHIY